MDTVMCLNNVKQNKEILPPSWVHLKGFIFSVPHWCAQWVVFSPWSICTSIPCTTKSLMFSWTVRMCFWDLLLWRMLRHSFMFTFEWFIPRCTESICLFRSVELGNILSHPSHVHSYGRSLPHEPSLHDASYYSWTETSFRILPQCIQISQDYQCCVFTWDVTSPEFLLASRMCTLIRFQLQVHRVDVLKVRFMQKPAYSSQP
jgi:hypothetical protein